MRRRNMTSLISAVFVVGLLAWASGPAAAAMRIRGQVQAGGGPVAQSAVTLWAGSANAPVRFGQATTDADGRFVVSTDQTPAGDSSLYLVASGGSPSVGKARGNNPGIAFLAVLGATPPANVTVNEMTTIASVWTNAQFLNGAVLSGHALGLRIASGNVPNFVDLVTGGWGGAIQDPLNSGQTPDDGQLRDAGRRVGRLRHARGGGCLRPAVRGRHTAQGSAPTDTLTAAEAIARYPWYQPERLFALLDAFYPVRRSGAATETAEHAAGAVHAVPLGRPARGCCRSSSTAAATGPAARRCSTARAISGSATTSRSGGRGRTRCGRATPPSSRPTASRFRRSRPDLPAAVWRAARSAPPSTRTTMPGSPRMAVIRSRCSTRTASR